MGKKWRGVYEYPSHGTRRAAFIWGEGHQRLGKLDIKGGNLSNPVVQRRVAIVESWVAQGYSTVHIQQLVKSLPAGRRGRPPKKSLS